MTERDDPGKQYCFLQHHRHAGLSTDDDGDSSVLPRTVCFDGRPGQPWTVDDAKLIAPVSLVPALPSSLNLVFRTLRMNR